jgi:hypothetical protein
VARASENLGVSFAAPVKKLQQARGAFWLLLPKRLQPRASTVFCPVVAPVKAFTYSLPGAEGHVFSAKRLECDREHYDRRQRRQCR